MSCLTLTLTPVGQPTLAVTPGAPATLAAGPVQAAALAAGTPLRATLTVGEVCTVCGEAITVFAGSDGPFRNRSGGFFLLDPARSPAD